MGCLSLFLISCNQNDAEKSVPKEPNQQILAIITTTIDHALSRSSLTEEEKGAKKAQFFEALSKATTKQDSINLVNELIRFTRPKKNATDVKNIKGTLLDSIQAVDTNTDRFPEIEDWGN